MANSHLLDLSDKKQELDKIFSSVITKIPDVCMPQTYRWAKEDDFFGRTKHIEHEPFRKQHYFDKCISLESQLANQNQQSGTPTSKASKLTVKQPEIKIELENLEGSRTKHIRNKFELNRMRKRQLRKLLKKRYSGLSAGVKTISDHCRDNSRLGYDRLFISMPEANYPYANPMPSCMMTKDNIDNLREIIVATTGVEWKMLTPVQPDNEYEEKYFDKLINLHRLRHKARLECGYYETNRIVPFKHVRHNYLINADLPSSTSDIPLVQVDTLAKTSSETAKEERQDRQRDKQKELLLDVEIPKLTLSSDEKIDELIMENPHHRRPSRACPGSGPLLEKRPTPRQDRIGDDRRVEDRVEAIVNQLMFTSLDD